MGSCWSCLYRDPIRDNHLTKFKVINVDDEGNELGSGIMELTQTELILHTRKRDAIRWPYLCLRRYGYDSNLFSFESGRRCQTGQGIFAFKCSRAEEIFNLLQELMQCNSINVVEESMMMSRSGHTPEMDMSRTPQTPNAPAFPVQSFPNGYPGYPMRGDSSQPSLEDHGHSLMGLEDQTHTYVNTVSMDGDLSMRHCVHSLPEVRPNALPETTRGSMPVVGQGNPQSNLRCCPLEERKDPQVFLQPSSQEVKFMLGPTPAQRHLMERERLGHNPHNLQPAEGATGSETEGDEPTMHLCNSHSYHHFHHHMHRHPSHDHPDSSQSGELTYENINGLRSGRKQRLSPSSVSQSVGSSSSSSTGDSHSHSLLHSHGHGPSSLPPQGYACERGMGGGHRRTALLNYENLPSLPPVWEYSALHRDDEQEEDDEDQDEDEYEEEEDDFDEYEFSEGPGTPNGYHQDSRGIHRDALQNYVNTEQVQPPRLRHPCPPHPRACRPDSGGRIFSFDFRRRSRSGVGGCEHSHMPASRQLNYIQVDLEDDPPRQGLSSGGSQPQHQRLPPKKCGPPVPRRSECYAVIDLKKTAAMSNLQKALPRDDGTSRKTRHNSTDLPL
ncbi:fibroblast growth factor receptor substrate 2 [Fundulus diaphanus]